MAAVVCRQHPERLIYASNQFLVDLLVWYHLGWMAESVQRADARVQRLQDKAHDFTAARPPRAAADPARACCARWCRATARLAERGQVELRDEPLRAPDPAAAAGYPAGARDAARGCTLPLIDALPGRARARALAPAPRQATCSSVTSACTPAGCWPSEGALSDATLELLAEEGFRWSASGESVLRNSMARTTGGRRACTRPRLPASRLPLRREHRRLLLPRRRAVGPDRLHLFGVARR